MGDFILVHALEVYDAQPVITSIERFYAPGVTAFVVNDGPVGVRINGRNLGSDGQIQVDGTGVTCVRNTWNTDVITAVCNIDPTAEPADHTVTVIAAKGVGSNQFQSNQNQQSKNQGSGVMRISAVVLTSFRWEGSQQYYEDSSDWFNDSLSSEGSNLISTPQWDASRSDPAVFFISQESALGVSHIQLQITPPFNSLVNATLRISSSQTDFMRFNDLSLGDISGLASYSYDYFVAASGAPTQFDNFGLHLNWNIDLDGGRSFNSNIGATDHKIVVTFGAPAGLLPDLAAGRPERRQTAARINYVTSLFRGTTNAELFVAGARDSIADKITDQSGGGPFTFGDVNLYDPGQPKNPWTVIDQIQKGSKYTFDCLSFVQLAFVQIGMAGIPARFDAAYPVALGWDATFQKTGIVDGHAARLEWYGVGPQAPERVQQLEAYLFALTGTIPSVAHMVIPKDGPLQPWPVPSEGLDSSKPQLPLAFRVFYETLRISRHASGAVPGVSGQQFWIDIISRQPLGPVVPFPVLIP